MFLISFICRSLQIFQKLIKNTSTEFRTNIKEIEIKNHGSSAWKSRTFSYSPENPQKLRFQESTIDASGLQISQQPSKSFGCKNKPWRSAKITWRIHWSKISDWFWKRIVAQLPEESILQWIGVKSFHELIHQECSLKGYTI